MPPIKLYVKSEKINLADPVPNWGTCSTAHLSTGHTSRGTFVRHSEGDEKARMLLDDCNLQYKIIDLSKCSFLAKIHARLAGISETPTLVVDDWKYSGFESVKKFLNEQKQR